MLQIVLSILLVSTLLFNIPQLILDIEYNYSSANEMVRFIKDNNMEGEEIFVNCEYAISSLSAYNKNIKYYSPSANRYVTFIICDKYSFLTLTAGEMEEDIKANKVEKEI